MPPNQTGFSIEDFVKLLCTNIFLYAGFNNFITNRTVERRIFFVVLLFVKISFIYDDAAINVRAFAGHDKSINRAVIKLWILATAYDYKVIYVSCNFLF